MREPSFMERPRDQKSVSQVFSRILFCLTEYSFKNAKLETKNKAGSANITRVKFQKQKAVEHVKSGLPKRPIFTISIVWIISPRTTVETRTNQKVSGAIPPIRTSDGSTVMFKFARNVVRKFWLITYE